MCLDAGAKLRPVERLEGIYILSKEPMDTEIVFLEPGMLKREENFLLEHFECELLLKNILKLKEEHVNVILDRLWNFYFVAFRCDIPEVVVTRPELVSTLEALTPIQSKVGYQQAMQR